MRAGLLSSLVAEAWVGAVVVIGEEEGIVFALPDNKRLLCALRGAKASQGMQSSSDRKGMVFLMSGIEVKFCIVCKRVYLS